MRYKFFILLAAVMVFFTACDTDEPTRSNPTAPEEAASVDEGGASTTAPSPLQEELNLLARGLALALSDDGLRVQLLEDLRDSPFRFHQVHLQSYLRGEDGQRISEAAAAELGLELSEFYELMPNGERYQLGLHIPLDRVTWEGGREVVVAAWPYSRAERWEQTALTGYDLTGGQTEFPTYRRIRSALVSLHPAEFVDFGEEPEVTRQNAPAHARSTVNTWEEESFVAVDHVDHGGGPAGVACGDCDGSGGSDNDGRGPPVLVSSGCTETNYNAVTSSNDQDVDGIKDACEAEFMEKLGPRLAIAYGEDCKYREPYWTVEKNSSVGTNGHGFRMGALLSYYWDCGGLGHDGDSEFILINANVSGNEIRMYYATLSAHWGAPNDQTSDVSGNWFNYDSNDHPIVFVSENKHANFSSESNCDYSTWDTCDPYGIGNSELWGFWISGNIGNEAHPFDIDPNVTAPSCANSRVDTTQHPGMECYANPGSPAFDGWNSTSDETTRYYDVLSAWGLL